MNLPLSIVFVILVVFVISGIKQIFKSIGMEDSNRLIVSVILTMIAAGAAIVLGSVLV